QRERGTRTRRTRNRPPSRLPRRPWRMRHDRRRDGTSDVHRADLAGFVYWHRLDDRRVASLALTVAGFILEDRPHRAHHKLIVEPGCAGVPEQPASRGHRRGAEIE